MIIIFSGSVFLFDAAFVSYELFTATPPDLSAVFGSVSFTAPVIIFLLDIVASTIVANPFNRFNFAFFRN